LSDSSKKQVLLNIIKLRYSDMPLFMAVSSIVSGYTLESSVSLTGTVYESGDTPASAALGRAGKFTDRPTITYSPLTGNQFNRTFLTPVPPSAVLSMVQAGWPVDSLFHITLKAINGLYAQRSASVGL